jgi:hypothetical protein
MELNLKDFQKRLSKTGLSPHRHNLPSGVAVFV